MTKDLSDTVSHSFLYVPDKSPILVFDEQEHASTFQKGFVGAKIYANKRQVTLPTPHGLELVRGGEPGKTAYVFHRSDQAKDWFEKLNGFGLMYTEGEAPSRSVFLGASSNGHSYGGEPIWPAVA